MFSCLRCLVHEFSLLTILFMVTEQLYWRKVFCGYLRLLWLWLLIAIMKRCAEWCALQLYLTSFSNTHSAYCVKSDFFSEFEQIINNLQIWSHVLRNFKTKTFWLDTENLWGSQLKCTKLETSIHLTQIHMYTRNFLNNF